MKQLFAISFILALIIPFTGTFMWLSHQKKMVRKEVKHMMMKGLDKEELITFTFTTDQINNELKWKHSKEFEYKGDMYDIVSYQNKDGLHTYSCWLDKKETKLNRELAMLFGEKWKREKNDYQDQTHLNHFVDSLFIGTLEMIVGQLPDRNIMLMSYVDTTIDVSINPVSPPPEFFIIKG